ncbi:MAG: class I SAM-dependent methyltransferase [Hyphomicrobiaceae bacterium]
MHAAYGAPPPELAAVPGGAVQCSALVPGSAALETFADGSLAGATISAPRGALERRYVIAHALRALRPGARFTVLAHNKQGGTRLADELAGFGCVAEEVSKHHHRICTGACPEALDAIDTAITDGAPRLVEPLGLWSQPGIFSWDRIDPGSALLIEHLPALTGRGADLGCGIGILARAILGQAAVKHVTLIDIDRRAIDAAKRNVEAARSTALWADATVSKALPSNLDFVVMNPPFHDGGAEDQNLGRAFIAKAAGMLRKGGLCMLVANRHLPYEAAMTPLFSDVTQVVQAGGYKIYAAVK